MSIPIWPSQKLFLESQDYKLPSGLVLPELSKIDYASSKVRSASDLILGNTRSQTYVDMNGDGKLLVQDISGGDNRIGSTSLTSLPDDISGFWGSNIDRGTKIDFVAEGHKWSIWDTAKDGEIGEHYRYIISKVEESIQNERDKLIELGISKDIILHLSTFCSIADKAIKASPIK